MRVVPPEGLAPGRPRIATPSSKKAAAFQSSWKVFSSDESMLTLFESDAGSRASSGAVVRSPNEGTSMNTFPGLSVAADGDMGAAAVTGDGKAEKAPPHPNP